MEKGRRTHTARGVVGGRDKGMALPLFLFIPMGSRYRICSSAACPVFLHPGDGTESENSRIDCIWLFWGWQRVKRSMTCHLSLCHGKLNGGGGGE